MVTCLIVWSLLRFLATVITQRRGALYIWTLVSIRKQNVVYVGTLHCATQGRQVLLKTMRMCCLTWATVAVSSRGETFIPANYVRQSRTLLGNSAALVIFLIGANAPCPTRSFMLSIGSIQQFQGETESKLAIKRDSWLLSIWRPCRTKQNTPLVIIVNLCEQNADSCCRGLRIASWWQPFAGPKHDSDQI